MDKLVIPNPNWLDTGCGTGTLAARVFEMRDDVRFTLADPSVGMLEKAKEKLSGRDVASDICPRALFALLTGFGNSGIMGSLILLFRHFPV